MPNIFKAVKKKIQSSISTSLFLTFLISIMGFVRPRWSPIEIKTKLSVVGQKIG